MSSIGLFGTKGGVKSRLVLSLIIVGVFLGGCQAPPSSSTPDARASASPKAAAKGETPYAEKVETPDVSEAIKVEPKPEETEDVPVKAVVVSPPAEQSDPVTVQEGTPDQDKPAVAEVAPDKATPVAQEGVSTLVEAVAVLPDNDPNVTPVTAQATDVTSPASVATEAMKTSVVPSADAKIFVVDSVFDFGEITPLDKPTGTFHLKNIGTDTLHLTRVKVCCGAQHKLSSDALEAGESSVLNVTYIANAIGKFQKYLTVYSNDVNSPSVKLTIKGNVVRRLAWTPDRFKLILDQENGGCLPVRIRSLDDKPFSLILFSATEDCLVADIDPNKVAKEFVLQPKVDLEKLGSLKIPKGVVRIGHTHPGCDVIKLYYDLVRRYAFAPKRFLVLNADPRQTKIQRLTILDNYADSLSLKADGKGSMFGIESVVCEKGSAVLKSTKQVQDGFQLTFEIKPPDPAGQRLFQDLITIKLSIGNELQVPVNGIYSMAALSVSQDKE
jgi:hypothetical protein